MLVYHGVMTSSENTLYSHFPNDLGFWSGDYYFFERNLASMGKLLDQIVIAKSSLEYSAKRGTH